MKEWKNKDVVIGLIVVIILGLIALFLLIRREVRSNSVIQESVTEESTELFSDDDTVREEESIFAEEVIVEEKVKEETDLETMTEDKISEGVSQSQNVTGVQNVGKNSAGSTEKGKVDLYAVLGEEKYKGTTLIERKKDDGQLKELYEYWEAYKLNAVGDLIRLERFREISEELQNSNKFYYYGTTDALGRPNGKGLAVYADNTYYYGDWKDGMRHGKGMWLEVAIYTEENQQQNLGLIEHSYNGQWSKDLPNGEGQEHFSYDYSILKEEYIEDNGIIANVLGGFKDGYYHGEMYVMTADEEGNTLDWIGNCENGVWEILEKGTTTDAVWQSYQYDGTEEFRYHYLYPVNNNNWGIRGLKK